MYCLVEDNVNKFFNDSNEIFKSNLRCSKSVDSEEKIKYKEERNEESECSCICDGRCPNYFYRQVNEKYVCCCTHDNIKNVVNLNCKPCSKPDKQTFDEIRFVIESMNKGDDKYNENYTSKLLDNSILITKDQGLMEVHIIRLQLSKTAVRLLSQDNIFWNAFFFVSWDIKGLKTSFTPALKYPNLNFDSSSIFVVSELFKFLNYIFEKYITFQVHAFYPNEAATHTVAQTKLCIKKILDYPHNKMQYISSVTSVIPCSYGTNFGHLSLWVRLGCNPNKIKTFKTQRGTVSEDIHLESFSKIKKPIEEQNSIYSSLNRKKKSKESVKNKGDNFMGKEDKGKFKNVINKTDYAANVESIERKVDETGSVPENKGKINRNSFFKMDPKNSNISSISTSDFTENDISSEENGHLKILEKLKAKLLIDSCNQIADDIVEFNKMLSNNLETQVDSVNDINEVLTDDNWDKYKSITNQNTDEKSEDNELDDDDDLFFG